MREQLYFAQDGAIARGDCAMSLRMDGCRPSPPSERSGGTRRGRLVAPISSRRPLMLPRGPRKGTECIGHDGEKSSRMICSAELAHFSRLGRPRAANMSSLEWNSRKRSCDVISIMESVGTLLPARKNPDPESNAPVRTSGRQHTFLCAASHVGANGNTRNVWLPASGVRYPSPALFFACFCAPAPRR
jgi:hypothetical protein